MNTVVKKQSLITPKFRMSFPALFTQAKPMKDGDEPKYSITCLFPPGCDLSNLQKAAVACAVDKWGDTARDKIAKGKIRSPFRKQDEKEGMEGYEPGGIFIIARSGTKPNVVGPNVQPVTDPSMVYPGRWARASLTTFAWTHKTGGLGVSFGLSNVQLLEDDKSFGAGRSKASDDFQPVDIGDDGGKQLAEAEEGGSLFGV